MTDIDELYQDPIISLVQDPNLNKDSIKTNQLIQLINKIQERKVNKLCSTTFKILKSLDSISLKFKSWEFLSLNFNSNSHFNNDLDSNIKQFNTNVSDKVIKACSDININMAKITCDIDLISSNSKLLNYKDLISDEGTMLTSLLLRVIKLKNEIIDQLSISYAKAKLILIGKELEEMENEEMLDIDESIIDYYKSFIIALLNQLNKSVEVNDFESKFECLAVINDLEQMFEKFKIEKLFDKSIEQFKNDNANNLFEDSSNSSINQDDSFSEYSVSSSSQHLLPVVHSITSPSSSSTMHSNQKQDSLYEMTSSQLYKSTISEELPYLMTAFSSAKNFKHDVSHYKQEEEKHEPKSRVSTKTETKKIPEAKKPFFHKSNNLPNSALYSETNLIPSTPPFYNNSLLRTFGIKPQVISIPNEHDEIKENQQYKNHLLLTKENITTLQQDFID